MQGLVEALSRTLRNEGFLAVARKTARYPLKPLFVSDAIKALREQSNGLSGPDEIYDFVRDFNHRGIAITSWQIRSEITCLLDLLSENPPRSVLEIGTAQGGTLFMLTRAARPDATIISVDLPGGALGVEFVQGEHGYPKWRTRLYRGFARDAQRMHVLRADSHSETTCAEVERLLEGKRCDLLFVDGDHSYDGVKQDFEMYAPLVNEGGLIAFHDIVPGGPGKRGDPGGVPMFWQEVKSRYPVTREFVEDWDWGSCGIGVIRR